MLVAFLRFAKKIVILHIQLLNWNMAHKTVNEMDKFI